MIVGARSVLLCLCLVLCPGAIDTNGQAPPQPQAGDNAIRLLVELARQKPGFTIRGAALQQPAAIAKFFEARAFTAPWPIPAASTSLIKAIRAIEDDGLTPSDYHLAALTAALEAYTKTPSAAGAAELQLLMADAAASLIDHVRYGRVLPATLDRRWNVDPRLGAPALDVTLDQLARSSSVDAGIEALKPNHFIYQGLRQALARTRAIAKAGGWPAVAAGPAIKPGATGPRVAAVRKRLAVTGELPPAARADAAAYDAALEAAVKTFQAHHRLADDGVIGRGTIEAMNVTAEARVQQLRVNLERARWVVGGLHDSFVLVNLPAFKAYVIRDRKNIWETRTQIGREARKTPTFRADLKYLVFNPDWTVPPIILAQDVLAGMRKGENTIARKKLTILDDRGRQIDSAAID